jgi:hypothetical protein
MLPLMIIRTSFYFIFQAYGHEDPNMHPNNEANLYGLVETNVHPQVLASSSQVNLLLNSVACYSL